MEHLRISPRAESADVRAYVTARADLLEHGFDPDAVDLGTTCVVTFGADLYRRALEHVQPASGVPAWPYSPTPLTVCETARRRRFSVHFPSYGGPRIANSLEQLAACGVQEVIGLGLGGTPRAELEIGDVVLLEGAIRGDGVSRYYVPDEYPAVADLALTARLRDALANHGIPHHMGLSFGTDALYREQPSLIADLRALGVVSIDLESSALFTVGRRLGRRCAWLGVLSDRLVDSEHEGSIHSGHVAPRLLELLDAVLGVIESGLEP
jgi:uridine phosphorylase